MRNANEDELKDYKNLEKEKIREENNKPLNYIVTPQPPSIPNDNIHSWDVVIREYKLLQNHEFVPELVHLMEDRDVFGFSKYKTHLQPYNGRNSLADAMQEMLDGLAYVQTAILENKDIDGILHENMQKLYLILEDLYLIYLDDKNKK